MLPRLREIRNQITANDAKVLRHSLGFVQELLRAEQDRGKTAETRATAVLAVLGILAVLMVPFIATIEPVTETSRPFLYVILAASISFLLRGIYYAIRTLGIAKQFRLTPYSVYDFQSANLKDVLRDDIAATIWSYEQAKNPNTRKLFWLNRAQRNGMVAIFLYPLLGASLIVLREGLMTPPLWTTYAAATLAVLAWLLFDRFAEAERFGIWRRS